MKEKNDSLLYEKFTTSILTELECQNYLSCKNYNVEDCWSISLPVTDQYCDVTDSLKLFFKESNVLDYHCSQCKRVETVKRKLSLIKTPDYLIFNIKKTKQGNHGVFLSQKRYGVNMEIDLKNYYNHVLNRNNLNYY